MTEEEKRYGTKKINGIECVADRKELEALDPCQCVNRLNAYESRVKELEGRLVESQGWLREILKMGLTGDMEGLGSIQDRLLNGEGNTND